MAKGGWAIDTGTKSGLSMNSRRTAQLSYLLLEEVCVTTANGQPTVYEVWVYRIAGNIDSL